MHSPRIITLLVIVALLATIPSTGRAQCKPDTSATQTRTLIHGLAALHFDEGVIAVPLNGQSEHAFQGSIGVSWCRWPAYTLTFADEGIEGIRTDYRVPGSTFSPPISVQAASWSITRRWRLASIFHPMVALTAGSVHMEYDYVEHLAGGFERAHTDGSASTTYVAPSVGLEANLFNYVTSYVAFGRRYAGHLATPGLDHGGISGFTTSFGFGFGKFR